MKNKITVSLLVVGLSMQGLCGMDEVPGVIKEAQDKIIQVSKDRDLKCSSFWDNFVPNQDCRDAREDLEKALAHRIKLENSYKKAFHRLAHDAELMLSSKETLEKVYTENQSKCKSFTLKATLLARIGLNKAVRNERGHGEQTPEDQLKKIADEIKEHKDNAKECDEYLKIIGNMIERRPQEIKDARERFRRNYPLVLGSIPVYYDNKDADSEYLMRLFFKQCVNSYEEKFGYVLRLSRDSEYDTQADEFQQQNKEFRNKI